MKFKKAIGFTDLIFYSVLIIIFIVALSIGTMIVTDIKDDAATTNTQSIWNETHIITFNTPFYLSYAPVRIINITNISANAPILVSSVNINASLTNYDKGYLQLNWSGNLSINYYWDEIIMNHAYNISSYGEQSTLTLSKQSSTLALVLIASVIIGVISSSFLYGMKKRQ